MRSRSTRSSAAVVRAIVGALGLLGCSTPSLSTKGSTVHVSRNGPGDEGFDIAACKNLGEIIGKGGGFGGGWIANEELTRYAITDLRNKAAEAGANYVQYDSPEFGVSGDKDSTTTTSATVTGTAYRCDAGARWGAASAPAASAEANAWREAEAKQRAARSAARPPELGSTPTESAGLCASQGGVQTVEPAQEDPGAYHICRIGSVAIFAAHVSPGAQFFDAVKAFYEGADVGEVRQWLEGSLGPPDVMTVEQGFRVWKWERTNPRAYLRVYNSGVSVTMRQPDPTQPTLMVEGQPN